MLEHVPPSLVAFIQVSLLVVAGLGLVLWARHRDRRARAVAGRLQGRVPAPQQPSMATARSDLVGGVAFDFFAPSPVRGPDLPSSPPASAPGAFVQPGGPGGAMTSLLVLGGVLLLCLAGLVAYRNASGAHDYGMPEQLLGLEAVPRGSVLGRDVEDANTKADREGLDVRAQLYGSASGWVYVSIATGDLVTQTSQNEYVGSVERRLAQGSTLTRDVPLTEWRDVDPGPLGGSMRCSAVQSPSVAACAWIDPAQGRAGTVILANGRAVAYLDNSRLVLAAVATDPGS